MCELINASFLHTKLYISFFFCCTLYGSFRTEDTVEIFLLLVTCSSTTLCLEEAGSCTEWSDCYSHHGYAPDLICRTGCNGAQFGPSDRCCKDGQRCGGTTDDCCTPTTPCDLGDGDCDEDNECLGSLVCGLDNCDTARMILHQSTINDCCENP